MCSMPNGSDIHARALWLGTLFVHSWRKGLLPLAFLIVVSIVAVQVSLQRIDGLALLGWWVHVTFNYTGDAFLELHRSGSSVWKLPLRGYFPPGSFVVGTLSNLALSPQATISGPIFFYVLAPWCAYCAVLAGRDPVWAQMRTSRGSHWKIPLTQALYYSAPLFALWALCLGVVFAQPEPRAPLGVAASLYWVLFGALQAILGTSVGVVGRRSILLATCLAIVMSVAWTALQIRFFLRVQHAWSNIWILLSSACLCAVWYVAALRVQIQEST
jgi:hypothetical protein